MLPGVIPWVKENLLKSIDYVMDQCAFEKEHRFWARALAATQIAAILVDKAGLITFSPDRIMDWALHHFSAKVITREEKLREQSMVPVLLRYFSEHLDETLTMPCAAEGKRQFKPLGELPRRKVSIRIEADTETAYVAVFPLRVWLEKNAGGGYSDMVAELESMGLLKQKYVQRTLTAGTVIIGGQLPCMVVDIGHPAMSGIARAVHEEERREARNENLRRIN